MRSQQINKLISLKCNEVINKKKSNLEYIGRTIPYGYALDKKTRKLIIDKNSSHVVYTIFDLYDKGYGFTTIAEFLNARGIVPPSLYNETKEYIKYFNTNCAIKWEKSSVRKIIMNRVYTGSYRYTTEKTHDSIINNELWDSVQTKIKNKITDSTHDFYDKNGNEFSGKVFCSLCGKSFTIETSRCKDGKIKYLRCSCYDRRGNHKYNCDNKLAIRYDELRDIVDYVIGENVLQNIDFKSIANEYIKFVKNDSIGIHRKYLKQEKKILKELIYKYELLMHDVTNNNLYDKLLLIDYNKRIKNYNERLHEIDMTLKEIYSFARIKNISTKELFFDKFIIDNFINKIEIGALIDNTREIKITLY